MCIFKQEREDVKKKYFFCISSFEFKPTSKKEVRRDRRERQGFFYTNVFILVLKGQGCIKWFPRSV